MNTTPLTASPLPAEGVVGRNRVDPGVASAGPSEQFARFYDACCRFQIAALCAARGGDLPRCERIVRRVFELAWTRWSQVRELPDPHGWVREQAWSRDARPPARPGARRPRGWSRRGTPVALSALGELPCVQRRALVLRHIVGLEVPEIAREEDAQGQTVEQRLRHGTLAFLAAMSTGTGANTDRVVPVPSAVPEIAVARRLDALARELSFQAEPAGVERVTAAVVGRRAGLGLALLAGSVGAAAAGVSVLVPPAAPYGAVGPELDGSSPVLPSPGGDLAELRGPSGPVASSAPTLTTPIGPAAGILDTPVRPPGIPAGGSPGTSTRGPSPVVVDDPATDPGIRRAPAAGSEAPAAGRGHDPVPSSGDGDSGAAAGEAADTGPRTAARDEDRSRPTRDHRADQARSADPADASRTDATEGDREAPNLHRHGHGGDDRAGAGRDRDDGAGGDRGADGAATSAGRRSG